jgi:hypothetical protein
LKRRLILHLGLSKTGTTSIQAFLRGNPELLAAGGVSYPDLGGARSTHPALTPSILRPDADDAVNHEALALEIRKSAAASPLDDMPIPLWSGVFRRIEAGTAHTAIISYENFFSRPELYRFDRLEGYLDDFDIDGIIYLRGQEDWLASLYGQTVRGKRRATASFADFMKTRRADLAYSRMLDRVRAHIPLRDLVIGDFEKASGSGLIGDFIRRAGLSGEIPLPREDQGRANRSLPHWATLFLLRCNQAAISNETFLHVRRVLGAVRAEDVPGLRPGLHVATPRDRERLRALADADADRLKARYGVELDHRARRPMAHRPFGDEDVAAIREVLARQMPSPALEELDHL